MSYLEKVKRLAQQKAVEVVESSNNHEANLPEKHTRCETSEISEISPSTACTCPKPKSPAGCGPQYPRCSACGYTWYCRACGGCRQCPAPGRKVKGPVGDGEPPPLDWSPTNGMELRWLTDYLSDPQAFAKWFGRLMQQTCPAEEVTE
jgi:hypothetical protein